MQGALPWGSVGGTQHLLSLGLLMQFVGILLRLAIRRPILGHLEWFGWGLFNANPNIQTQVFV
jgi:hypothetical protein